MRDYIRLIVFAVIIFGVTSLAVFIGNLGFAANVNERLGLAEETEARPARFTEGEAVVRIPRPQRGTWVGLSGFPSQTTLRFPLPEGLSVLEGQVQLDLESTLIEQGDGLLTVLINGRERDAVVLERGGTSLRLTYPLLESDLASGDVLVTLSADGTTNYGQICPTNLTNLGAAISVAETSGVLLVLDAPRSDIETKIALAPDPLVLAAQDEPVLGAWAAQWLSRQGVPAEVSRPDQEHALVFVKEADQPITLSETDQIRLAGPQAIDILARLRGASLPATYNAQWPLPVTALSDDVQVHTFRGSSRWTLNYKLADLPDGSAPGMIHLALRTSQLADPNQWSLRVLLNGNIVHSANYPGSNDMINVDVPLQPELQHLSNQLVVVLVDNSPNQGICRSGSEAVAQLLPDTRFDAAPAPVGPKQTLVSALANAPGVSLAGPVTAGPSAIVLASALFDQILPLSVPVSPGEEDGVLIQMLDEPTLAALRDNAQADRSESFIVLPQDEDEPDGIRVVPFSEWRDSEASTVVADGAFIVSW